MPKGILLVYFVKGWVNLLLRRVFTAKKGVDKNGNVWYSWLMCGIARNSTQIQQRKEGVMSAYF